MEGSIRECEHACVSRRRRRGKIGVRYVDGLSESGLKAAVACISRGYEGGGGLVCVQLAGYKQGGAVEQVFLWSVNV